MGFFRAAFACVFFGVSNTLSIIVQYAKCTANALAFLEKNVLIRNLPPRAPYQLAKYISTGFDAISSLRLFLATSFISLLITFNTYAGTQVSIGTQQNPPTTIGMIRYGYNLAHYIYSTAEQDAVAICNSYGSGYSWSGKFYQGHAVCINPWTGGEFTGLGIETYTYCPVNYSNSANPPICNAVYPQQNLPCEDGYVQSGSSCIPNGTVATSKNSGGPYFNSDNNTCNGTNPINGSSGNKFQVETDYIGSGMSPLEFHRYYNSNMASRVIVASVSLGFGWLNSYNRTILLSSNSSTAFAYRPDGKIYFFTFDANSGDRKSVV